MNLVIVGAGGLGREAAEAVRAVNAVEPTWDLIGFLDDGTAAPAEVDGLPVLGPTSELRSMPEVAILVCTVRPDLYWSRKQITTRLDLPIERYATIVHPSAIIPEGSRIGAGSLVLAGVVATTRIDLGSHVVVMPGVIFTHDDRVADFVTFGAGVRLAGRVVVGEGAYVGAGALLRENRTIGPWALVGMGAAVTTDVPAGEVWAGVPARYLRQAEVPADIFHGHPL